MTRKKENWIAVNFLGIAAVTISTIVTLIAALALVPSLLSGGTIEVAVGLAIIAAIVSGAITLFKFYTKENSK